ncbi:MAG: zinc ribbon domain-containing protein [Anaerolineaceae bacterium]|nr:zinc ribbon domain-containing protein [Anaerolineaceae bacterium]
MPIYTYRCETCGVQFEQKQKFTDEHLKDCPECGQKEALRKVYTPVGIVFKGSGFYATDNRSPSGMKSASAASSEKKSDSEPSSKTETKPAKETTSSKKSEGDK